MNRPDLHLLAKYAALLPDESIIVEIGTHLGNTALILSEHSPDTSVVCTIDTGGRWMWEGNDLDDYEDFLRDRFKGHNIHFLLGNSQSVEWAGDIDLLFIDGDHSYDAVTADLTRWTPWVKLYGYVAFHDYVLGEQNKVYGAVQDFLSSQHPRWKILELESTMLICQRLADD